MANLILLLLCFLLGAGARRWGLGAAMLALGVPLSLVTVPLWWFALGGCGMPLASCSP
jgi:hypothetical protein